MFPPTGNVLSVARRLDLSRRADCTFICKLTRLCHLPTMPSPSNFNFSGIRVALWVGLLASGCVRSEHPLSAGKDSKPNLRLVGTWHGSLQTNEKSNLGLCYDAQGYGLVLSTVIGKWQVVPHAEFFVTRTDKASYLNILSLENPDGTEAGKNYQTYQFFKYEVSEDGTKLHLWATLLEPFRKAVQEGKLKGRFPDSNNVLLQDSPDAMLRFIESSPADKIFIQLDDFKKVD